jgi:hypothetical protein
MPKFNHNQPFGEVIGNDKAKYWQNGCHYDNQFNQLDGKIDVEPEADNELLDDTPETPAAPETLEPVDYSGMGWQAVKKLVEANDGVWTNKLDGVAFLQGL